MALKIGLWIARVIATVLIVCLLSIWTTSYVVTSYVQKLLEEYEIPLDVEPVALANVWGMIWGTEDRTSQQEQENKSLAGDANSLNEQETIAAKPEEEEEPSGTSNSQIEAEVSESLSEPSQEVFAPIEAGEETSIAPEDIQATKEELEAEEKERMFEIIMGKLPPESWQVFSSAVEDGLTDQELLEVQQLMAQHLTREEYDELMALLNND